jgi:hypothetical protein
VEHFEDELAALRFQGNSGNEEKDARSIAAREKMMANARTSQTIICALPLELTKEQNENLIEEFLEARFISRGLAVQYAYHDDKGNPHIHAQFTRRAVVDGQLSMRTDREITSKRELLITRELWAKVTNKHLDMAGHEVRIDHRSLEDQGSMFMPSAHEGWHAQRLAERGEYSRIVVQNDETRQLAGKLTDLLLIDTDVSHKIGANMNRDVIYTSTQYKTQEEALLSMADLLNEKASKMFSAEAVTRVIANLEQRKSQETGETGYRVLGTSFQGKAVEIMEEEIGIRC